MQIPEPTLRRALTGSSDLSATSLATKILVSRLRREIAAQPARLSTGVTELQAFFAKHQFAQNDLQAL